MIDELRIKKIKKLLREKRRLRRQARALEPCLKAGIDSLEIEITKAYGDLRARLKIKYNTAAYRYSQHLSLMARLGTQIAGLEEKITKLSQDDS